MGSILAHVTCANGSRYAINQRSDWCMAESLPPCRVSYKQESNDREKRDGRSMATGNRSRKAKNVSTVHVTCFYRREWDWRLVGMNIYKMEQDIYIDFLFLWNKQTLHTVTIDESKTCTFPCLFSFLFQNKLIYLSCCSPRSQLITENSVAMFWTKFWNVTALHMIRNSNFENYVMKYL